MDDHLNPVDVSKQIFYTKNISHILSCHNKTKLAGMVVTATQRLKKLEVDLNTFQIGQNETFSTQNYKIDIQEHKTNMVYEINGANNLYFNPNKIISSS